MRVWMPSDPGGGFMEFLLPLLDEAVELVDGPPCDVLVKGVPEPAQVEGVSAVVIPYAGVPKRTREIVGGIALYNLHHNAAPTAELGVALLLAAAKRILPLDSALRRGDWRPRYEESRELLLDGRTAVVLGHGAIGQRVARACEGLGMKVVALRRGDAVREHLPGAHALIVCVPWTAATEGMIGGDELALLPDGAVVVNIARGPVIDERALYETLAAGRLRAGLDVWYEYPGDEDSRRHTPPSQYPFGDLDNVVLSPHRGGLTDATERLRAEHLARVLNALARGEEPAGRVDCERGY